MKNLELVVSILQVGFVGFAFLLAFLAYRLLRNESDKEKPKAAILAATSRYMTFAVVLCFLAVAAQFGQTYLERKDHSPTPVPYELTIEIQSLRERVSAIDDSLSRLGTGRNGSSYTINNPLMQGPGEADCPPGAYVSRVVATKGVGGKFGVDGISELQIVCTPVLPDVIN